jgi:hypothetical protein
MSLTSRDDFWCGNDLNAIVAVIRKLEAAAEDPPAAGHGGDRREQVAVRYLSDPLSAYQAETDNAGHPKRTEQ